MTVTNVELDKAVAECLGHRVVEDYGTYIRIHLPHKEQSGYTTRFCPTTDWQDGGPIIERECISLDGFTEYPAWIACMPEPNAEPSYGPTPLIAAMRAFVSTRLEKLNEDKSEQT
jgi:hypothetical protein